MQSENSLPERDSAIPRWQQLISELGLFEQIESSLPGGQSLSISTPPSKIAAIQRWLVNLAQSGQVIELRVLGINGKKRTDSGYFDDLEKLAKVAASYDGRAEGIYFTVNPVNPALIARANNRVRQYAEHTTSDHDILKRINLPIDFDPVRPAGISSTDEEQHAALVRAWACCVWLNAQGWPEPVFASSGNGAHLLYSIDLTNDERSADLIKACLSALSFLFSDTNVKVDTSTSNASRIFKLYGTLACKGDNTPDRPHRRAAILAAPEIRQTVSVEQLNTLVALAPQAKPQNSQPTSAPRNSSASGYGRAALQSEINKLKAAPDGNRNNQLFQSAAALFSLVAANTLSSNDVWDALLHAAVSIGLEEVEARRTIASGEKRGASNPRIIPPPGESSHSSNEQPSDDKLETSPTHPTDTQKPSAQPANAPAQHLMHADALDSLPPIQWLIEEILPANNLVEVHGAPGAGKTQVVFDIAQTLAANGQTVIYVVAEGLQGYRGRKRAWQKFHKQGSGNLFIWDQAVHLLDTAAVQSFLQAAKPHNPKLIVFDTLSRCSLGADENNQKDMNFILEALDRVRRETGATVIAVHHTNAAGLRERGSTVIRGGMDVMLEVSKDDELIVVSCSKMKDAADFEPICLKPVLVDIGELHPVPVLIPAEKRIQTQADKLTPLQLEILKAIGMEMFADSGIRSSQLDEILPLTTKRASKYHSLNTLIKLGYVKPHTKGDPYHITEEGRQKLSSAESRTATSKSNESKASPSLFIWTLPEPCPMSSPVPHTGKCGTDETSDRSQDDIESTASLNETSAQSETISEPGAPIDHPDGANTKLLTPSMTEDQIARYAKRADVVFPTTNGADLYRICAVIPKSRRAAFELGLGDAVGAYYQEIARQDKEPPEPPTDPVESFVRSGLVSAEELFEGYEQSRVAGQAAEFLAILKQRNDKASELLLAWISGKRPRGTVFVPNPV